MYKDDKIAELKAMNTKVYPQAIDASNDIWSVYVHEPKEVRERRKYVVVDGWHRITALKRMKESNPALDVAPQIRIFHDIGQFTPFADGTVCCSRSMAPCVARARF